MTVNQVLANEIEVAIYTTDKETGKACFKNSFILERNPFDEMEVGDTFECENGKYVYLGEPEGCVKLLLLEVA